MGCYVWNDGSHYKGEWKRERMHGIGRICKNGVDILGNFHHDQLVC